MNFPSIRLEGAILTADLLDAIAREDKHSQKPADFGLDPSTKVKDEIASTWASAKALWTGYQAKIAALHEGQTGVSETRNLFIIPLLALLGYQPEKAEAEIVNGKSYAISHRDISRDSFPIHIMGWHDSLEKKRDTGGPRVSAHALVQEYLNLTEHSYGIITNGRQLRLLRDSSRLIKLSFLEFDLNRIFEEDLYADFAILFRLLHATRMPANRTHASASVIEKYHQDSVDSGSRIRDGLAAAVAFSMQTVANGLLAHPANASLVDQLRKDSARANELHQNLLRWVYRTLFVLVIEERVLHHAPGANLRQRQLYRDYYSLQRLRRLADRPQLADRRAHDLWRAMHQTLRLYEDGGKGLPLGIAPLGSFLFREEGLQHLFQYQLDNRSLLQALNRLSTFTHPDTNVRMRVNYGALDVEEFGSVYESLLELRPRIIPEGEKLSFSYAQLAGNERKTSGSYYTPDSLVQCLLDSALDPVIEERVAEAAKGRAGSPSQPLSGDELRQAREKALLSIKVCDPAVGSGHFLIGAAHRLAQRLADIRAGEEALSPDVQRHALRDVVSRCLYGVDINPLSVELCKVSLWMLGMEPGKPLGFLDHHIRCGNSLLGTTPELISAGLPDETFEAIEGDDTAACASLKKLNRAQREGLRHLFIAEDTAIRERMHQAAAAIDEISDNKPEDIHRKEVAFRSAQQNYDFQKAWDLANLWCAAFVIKKHFPASANQTSDLRPLTSDVPAAPAVTQGGLFGGTEEYPKAKAKKAKEHNRVGSAIPIGITTQHLRDFVESGALPDGLMAEAKELAEQYHFFHYHLAFPEVFAQGGFDVNLGNPPWERTAFEDFEFFAIRAPEVLTAETTALRKNRIAALKISDARLFTDFVNAKRAAHGENHFFINSGKHPLGASGRINTYALFTELALALLNTRGRVGLIVQSSLATDAPMEGFWRYLVSNRRLISLVDFENKNHLFPAVHAEQKFCLLTAAGEPRPKDSPVSIGFWLTSPDQITDSERVFQLTPDRLLTINPNTNQPPVCRTKLDFELVYAIHKLSDVLRRDGTNKAVANAWRALMTAASSNDFKTIEQLSGGITRDDGAIECDNEVYIPLLEAKLIHQFDSAYATFDSTSQELRKSGSPRGVQEKERIASLRATPRFWAVKRVVDKMFEDKDWLPHWILGIRDVTNVNNERTAIAAALPRVGLIQPLNAISCASTQDAVFVLGALNSMVLDYVARQKVSGRHLNVTTFSQLPIPKPT